MERVLLYLGRNADLATYTTYMATQPDSYALYGRSDSDWHVRHSTSGYHISLGCAAVAHAARGVSTRSPCPPPRPE